MTRKLCLDCNTRPRDKQSPEGQLCTECYDYAGWENTHSDDAHEQLNPLNPLRDNCPVCFPELDPRNTERPAPKPASRPTGRTNHSHAICYAMGAHDKSFAGRDGCRKFGGPDRYATDEVPEHVREVDVTEALEEIDRINTMISELKANPRIAIRDHSECTHTARGNGACVRRRQRATQD